MDKIIAKCGLDCSECGAYLAAVSNSDEIREETSKKWSKMFNAIIDPKTINCIGCQGNDKNKLFSHCLNCGIRSCALDKEYGTCAECPDFGCEKIDMIWKHSEIARKNLEDLR
jgi:hypothetical protein